MRCLDKVTALHPLTHRIAFFRSPLIFLSSCHAELVSASVRGDVLEMAHCEILKQVQGDICVLTAHYSQLITQTPTTKYRPLPVLRHPR